MKDNDFSCLINYSLNSDSSDLSDSSDSSESDASEASCNKSESKRTAHKATKADKGQQHSGPIKTDFWLYDTGSSVYIVNNHKWFKEYKPNTGNLRPVYTGGGPVMPKGVGTVVLETLYTTEGEDKYRTVSLHSVLLIPQLDVNIFSGIKHYAAGGSLGYNRLYGSNRKPFALLNFAQSCFFLSLKGYPVPRADHAHFSYLADIHRSYHIMSYSVEESTDPEDNAELSGNIAPEQPATKSATHPATATNLATDRYQKLLKTALLWHQRLGHPSLQLLKKTARATEGVPKLDAIKETDFRCISCDQAKAVRRPSTKPIKNPDMVLDRLEGDTFKISPTPHNKRPIGLIIVDWKSRYRWILLLKSREAPEVAPAIQGLFKQLKNQYGRYPTEFHYDGGLEACNKLLQAWFQRKGVQFTTSNPYTPEQNGCLNAL